MSKENIIEGSKLIAKYIGWVYVPSNDLQGFPKAGWFEVHPVTKNVQEVTMTSHSSNTKITEISEVKVDLNIFKYNIKNGWGRNDEFFYKFKYRSHNDLRFYNSFDALIPVIEKLEKEDLSEFHYEWEDARGKHNNFMSVEFIRWYNESRIDINLQLDPSNTIGSHEGEGIIKDTFHTIVDTIKYINKLCGKL